MRWMTGRPKLATAAAVVAADLSDRDAIARIARSPSQPFGAPDIVVHAAGINTRQPADEVTPEGWDITLALNLTAPFFLSQALVPAMKAKGLGPDRQFRLAADDARLSGRHRLWRLQGRDRAADPRHGRGLVARRDHRQCHRAGVLSDRTDRGRSSPTPTAPRAMPRRPVSGATGGWRIWTVRCCSCARTHRPMSPARS